MLNWISSPMAENNVGVQVLSPLGSTMMSFSLSSPPAISHQITDGVGSNFSKLSDLLDHDHISVTDMMNAKLDGIMSSNTETDLTKSVFSPSIFSPSKT